MGPSLSISNSSSSQTANSYISQQFSGTCDVSCQNVMEGVSVTLIGSNIGGNVGISQTCSTNAQCIIGSTLDSISDIQFTTANSSNAQNGNSIIPSAGSFSYSNSDSRQAINQSINQSSNEQCNVSSTNTMNNISIFAQNSNVGGNISLDQSASTQGSCQLSNGMSAAAAASGISTNTAKSGKDKKSGVSIYAIIGGIVVLLIVIFGIGKVASSYSQSSKDFSLENTLISAKMKAGCPGGLTPIMIDPRTLNPICPQK